jgi:hypothetical protein
MTRRPTEIPNQQQLIDALRSGQFYQTRHRVSDGRGGHCAIGVAAVLGMELTDNQSAFLQDLNNTIGLTFDEIARMLEVGRFAPPAPATPPAEDPIEARIRELRALVAGPLDAVR